MSIAALEMIQQLKALPATPDHLNPILVARMNEGEMTLTGCPLTSVHMLCHVCAWCPHTCTHTKLMKI